MTQWQRDDVPVERTWDLSSIYPDDAAWETEFASLPALLAELEGFRGRLGDSADTLASALALLERGGRLVGRLHAYAVLKHDQDTANPRYQALLDRMRARMGDVQAARSFLRPEVLALPEARVAEWVANTPALHDWAHDLEDLRRGAPHVLSGEEERVLAALDEARRHPGMIRGRLVDGDLDLGALDVDGEAVPLTMGTYERFQESPDRALREASFRRVMGGYGSLRSTLAATYQSHVRTAAAKASLRHHESARRAALHPNNIPVAVYDQLIDTSRAHLGLLQRYFALRKRALGVETLQHWDLRVPLGDPVDAAYSWEESVALVLASLAPMGEEYVQRARAGLAARWVDVHATPNKRSGAYSGGSHDTAPYILLNFQPGLGSLFTLAHELGHSMLSLYSREAQPWISSGYSMFVAEVASTLGEDLLTRHMLATTTDPALRLALIDQHLGTFRSTFFRQTMLAEFERESYRRVEAGGALTADSLEALHLDLVRDYHEPGLSVNPLIAHEWSYIPHFYYDFYVFQYATGLAAATALGAQVSAEGEPAARRVREFLARGSSEYSLDVLRVAGVDMRSAAPLEAAMGVVDTRLRELEAALDASQGVARTNGAVRA